MNTRYLRTFLIAAILLWAVTSNPEVSLSLIPTQDNEASPLIFETSYNFDVYYGHFRSAHILQTSIPPSLYHYYERKSHVVGGNGGYAKFVTPETFSVVAKSIREATDEASCSDEQFANAVLTLVRQIPYVKSKIKYPVEALVENSGDCDVLSLLAASIMKAGGLDVVLLYYKSLNPSHMNVGVALPYKPVYQSLWVAPMGFEYDNKTYWIAECTSRGDWKVGDMPELLANAKPYVIALNETMTSSPTQVSSVLDSRLSSSAISLDFSPKSSDFEGEERSLTLKGKISPAFSDRGVTMYVSRDGLAFDTYKNTTDVNGEYSFTWNFTQYGEYSIKTSWSGTPDYAGSDSQNLTLYAGTYVPVLTEHYVNYEVQDYMAKVDSATFRSIVGPGAKYLLKNNFSGNGLILSGEFMVLSENDTGNTMIEITLPKVERVIYFPRTRRAISLLVREEEVISQPIENNQLGFILRQNGLENFSASVGVLEHQETSQIYREMQENSGMYINASNVATRNRWFRIEALMSIDRTDARLYSSNNTLLDEVTAREQSSPSEMGILMAYPLNSILAFRGLEISELSETSSSQPSEEGRRQVSEFAWLIPYIGCTIILVLGFAVIRACIDRGKSDQTKPKSAG